MVYVGKAQVVSTPLLAFAVLAAGTEAPCFSCAGAVLCLGKTKAQAAGPEQHFVANLFC